MNYKDVVLLSAIAATSVVFADGLVVWLLTDVFGVWSNASSLIIPLRLALWPTSLMLSGTENISTYYGMMVYSSSLICNVALYVILTTLAWQGYRTGKHYITALPVILLALVWWKVFTFEGSISALY